jgi:hypothetical protein
MSHYNLVQFQFIISYVNLWHSRLSKHSRFFHALIPLELITDVLMPIDDHAQP